jgi:hypothetical protein
MTNHWRQRDITERLIAARFERTCRKLCTSGIIGTHNDELLTVLPDDIYWEAD